MFIYLCMILISVFFAFLGQSLRNSVKKGCIHKTNMKYAIYGFAAFLPAFMVSAFRNITVGTDTSGTYYQIYQIAQNGGKGRDFGFFWINKVAITLFHSYWGVIVITSLLICGISFFNIFRQSGYLVASTVLFFITNVYFISMNIIRQSLATAIFIYSICYIKERKLGRYMICMIIAFSIHSSSLLFIPVYFLYNIKLKRKYIYIGLLLTLLFTASISTIIESVFYKFEYTRRYFSWYFNSQYHSGSLSIYSLIISLCILLFLLYIHKNAEDDKEYNLFLWLQLLSVCILLLSARIPLAQRISWMLSFPQYIFLPKMFYFINNKGNRFLIKCGLYGGYTAYMIATIFILGYHDVYPYESILKGL